MRVAERNSLPHQPFGYIGGQRVSRRGERRHPLDVEFAGADQPGHRRQQQLQLRHRVENRLLVLLQVAVVSQRLSFQRRKQTGEVADQAA